MVEANPFFELDKSLEWVKSGSFPKQYKVMHKLTTIAMYKSMYT